MELDIMEWGTASKEIKAGGLQPPEDNAVGHPVTFMGI